MELVNLSKVEKLKLAELLKAHSKGETIEFQKLNSE